MIKTINPVSYDPIDLDKKAVVFAQITSALRNDIAETYTLHIKEWVKIQYTELVEVEGEMVEQEFTKEKTVRTHQRTMTFTEADALTDNLDQLHEIAETGTALRKRYTILGHLLVNNLENVRNTQWELV